MKLAACLICVLLSMSCGYRSTSIVPASPAQRSRSEAIEIEPGLHLRQVAPGAYEVTHELPWPANSLLVETVSIRA